MEAKTPIIVALITTIGIIVAAVIGTLPSPEPDDRNGSTDCPQGQIRYNDNCAPQWFPAVMEDLEKLREKHKVRQLLEIENDKRLSILENGVFGFSGTFFLEDFFTPVEDPIFEPRLNRFPNYGKNLEVHKLSDGSIYFVGFVSEEIFVELKKETKSTFSFYPMSYDKYHTLITIPVSDIAKIEEREFRMDYVLDITLKEHS